MSSLTPLMDIKLIFDYLGDKHHFLNKIQKMPKRIYFDIQWYSKCCEWGREGTVGERLWGCWAWVDIEKLFPKKNSVEEKFEWKVEWRTDRKMFEWMVKWGLNESKETLNERSKKVWILCWWIIKLKKKVRMKDR